MELWIRSQDKKKLIKIEKLFIDSTCPEMESAGEYYIGTEDWFGDKNYYKLGAYKSKERALEVLDEIQKQIKPLLYLKPKTCLELKTIKDAKRYFEKINSINFITTDSNFEIEPITTNVIVYELPKE